MNRYTNTLALVAILSTFEPVWAQPGMAPLNTAIAEYDAATGQVIVSVNEVFNWYIESVPFEPVFTGDPADLPAGFGLTTDNDFRIGQSRIGDPFTYTDVDLGNVAVTNLQEGDLSIFWDFELGMQTQSQPVICVGCVNGGLDGDYNNDNFVNAADYTVWRDGDSPDSTQTGYDVWKNNYGNVASVGASFGSLASATAIPEPASAAMMLLGIAASAMLSRPRR